jgi:hypothetical protein
MTNIFGDDSNIELPDFAADKWGTTDPFGVEQAVEYCDSCGAVLDPDDKPVHLCKICQAK